MPDVQDNLDRKRIETLAHGIMRLVRANYVLGPHSRDRVYEALNALAFSAAAVIAGTQEGAEEAWAFFDQAVEQNVITIRSDARG